MGRVAVSVIRDCNDREIGWIIQGIKPHYMFFIAGDDMTFKEFESTNETYKKQFGSEFEMTKKKQFATFFKEKGKESFNDIDYTAVEYLLPQLRESE